MRGAIQNRKSAPGVRSGRVQKKNRSACSPDVYVHDSERIVYQRMRPAKGFYHAVSVTDLKRFVRLIPSWGSLSQSLRAVILTPGGDWCYGRYNNAGIIKLDAWPRDDLEWFPARKHWLTERLGLRQPCTGQNYLSPNQARAFLLLGTFLHELGHHLDRVTTRSQKDAANGEPYAIRFELATQKGMWDAYVHEFGDPTAP